MFAARNYENSLVQDIMACAEENEADFIVIGSETKGYTEMGSFDQGWMHA